MTIETTKIRASIGSLQMLRALAALLVVLFHVTMTLDGAANINFLNGWFRFGNSGVEIFFVLSGFIIAYTAKKAIGTGDVRSYLTKRFIRIFPIYWIVITAFMIPAYFLSLNAAYDFTLTNVATTYLLLPNHQMLNGVSWSLSYELYFYVMFALVILRRWLLIVPVLVLAGVIVKLLGAMMWTGPAGDFYFSPYVLLFGWGVVIFYLFTSRPLRDPKLCIAGMAISAAAYLTFAETLHGVWYGTLYYGFFTGIFVFCAVSHERSQKYSTPRTLLLLGDASYILYLIHLPLINLAVKLAVRLALPPFAIIAVALCAAIGIVLASVLMHLWIEAPVNRVLKKAFGS